MDTFHKSDFNQPWTYVSFKISGKGLDPSIVTERLAISPDRSHLTGDTNPHAPRMLPYEQGLWSIDSVNAAETPLNGHLEDFLKRLIHKKNEIVVLSGLYRIEFYCTLFAQKGCDIPPDISRQISDFGAYLTLSFYP